MWGEAGEKDGPGGTAEGLQEGVPAGNPPHLSSCLVSITHPAAYPACPFLQLAKEFEKGIPADESILVPRLRELLISEFGATPKTQQQQQVQQQPATSAEPAGASA